MKAKKTLWIGFSSETKSGCYRVYEHDPHLTYAEPYHLHPGNEVKLRRENAMMRDTLKALWIERYVPNVCINAEIWERAKRKLPGLFAGGKGRK